nr:GDSL esterase/lipase At1g28590-like [Ipomoea batatas]
MDQKLDLLSPSQAAEEDSLITRAFSMAAYSSSSCFSPLRNGIICVSLALLLSRGVLIHVSGCYNSIISFGDSLADTGNLFHMSESGDGVPSSVPPYGETFFRHPTGRFSDGRLIIDFIALSLGLPLVQPYFSGKGIGERNFLQGVNFAVAGATAVDFSFYHERGIFSGVTNVSLGDELRWFKEMLPSFCDPPSECKKYLQSSLILMGEIGGNDYNDPFLEGHSIEEIQSFVPNVIATIGAAINELIELGGETFVVPGVLPFGCSPSYLSFFMNSTTNNDYDDKTGCIKWLNEFAEYHNEQLQKELHRLKELHPNTTIMYADYYHASMELYGSPTKHGLEQSLYACCGTGGPYNSRVDITCGRSPPIVCDKPSSFVSWDGVHLTEAAYQQMASMILEGQYMTPPINETCLLKPLSGEVSDH